MRTARAGRQGGGFRPAGVGIVVVGVLLLYFGLQFVRGGGHPLAATMGFDLCARLGPQPAPELPDVTATPQARIPDMSAGRASTCYWPIAGQPAPREVWLVLSTHQSLRADGNHRGTAKFVEVFLEESRASGAEVAPATGPWRSAATLRSRGGRDFQLLAEDDGVVLWFSGRGLERDTLITFAAAVARRLRAKS